MRNLQSPENCSGRQLHMQKSTKNSGAVIFQTSNIDSKIFVREQKGFFQRIRRSLGWILTILFMVIPFIQYQGEQAILFDLEVQKLNIFSMVLYPQDLFIFVLLLMFSAFALFFVSNKYGRIWCGYTCPQTIWTMMYLWVEHRVEGNRQARMKLDKMPYGLKKVVTKVVKHTLWLLIAVITAAVFMSYFVPAHDLYLDLLTLKSSSLVNGWVIFFTLCTYINAGWIREKMCEHMCPYSRFQSVMFNNNTKVIAYDVERGEQRGPRKINGEKPDHLGDCVDCNLCVQVCPVGIDIRNGLQYECISCGLCIDACDQTMDKFNYPRGLIKYSSINESANIEHANKKSINYAYALIMTIITVMSLLWIVNRSEFEVSVIKDRNVLYRETYDNLIENTFQMKIFNKSKHAAVFNVELEGLQHFIIADNQPIEVAPQERTIVMVTVLSPEDYQQKFTDFKFILHNSDGESELVTKTTFHGP